MTSRYIAVIPAYEPDRRMLGVIADLGKAGMDVIVVDDGSGPEYTGLFSLACGRLPGQSGSTVTLLTHEENRGKGAAIRTGLEYIHKSINSDLTQGYELWIRHGISAENTVVVTVDADGQHRVGDVIRTARAAFGDPGTLVIGSRGFDGNVPLRSRVGNTATREVFRLVSGRKIYDTQTGLRAFTADMIPSLLEIKGNRYEYEINMLLEMADRGTEIIEIPAETIYLDDNSSSHFDTVRDSLRIYREIGKYFASHTLKQLLGFSASSFASFLIDYTLYAVLLAAGIGLVPSNIGARLVSASLNYTINRRLVFRSNSGVIRSAFQYFGLAMLILTGNTIVLSALAGIGINRMAAKIITEIMFFAISWVVQRYVIFYREVSMEIPEDEREKTMPDSVNSGFTMEYRAVRPKRLRNIYCRNIRNVDL